MESINVKVSDDEESSRQRGGIMFTWRQSGRACQTCRLSTVQAHCSQLRSCYQALKELLGSCICI